MLLGLSCPVACGVFLDQGSNLCPSLAGGFFATEPPGKPCTFLDPEREEDKGGTFVYYKIVLFVFLTFICFFNW